MEELSLNQPRRSRWWIDPIVWKTWSIEKRRDHNAQKFKFYEQRDKALRVSPSVPSKLVQVRAQLNRERATILSYKFPTIVTKRKSWRVLPTSEKLMFTQQQILVKESRIQQKSKVVPAKLFPIAKQQSLKSKLKHQPQPHVIAGKLPGSKHRFVKAKMVSKPLLIGATNSSNAGPSIIARNIKFYNAADGVYNSFWVGKFINYFIRKGKKKTAIKLFHSTLLQLKLTNGTLPLINIIEALEQIRPSFRLSPWYRSGKQILYPKVVSRSNQYRLAARWLYEYIVDHRRESSEDKRKRLEGNKKAKKRAKRDKQLKGVIVKKPVKQEKERQVHINEDLPTRLYSKLIEFKQHRRHPLLKKRDALHVNVIRWQENIRYTWRS